jgi:rRNA processing protein Gar1
MTPDGVWTDWLGDYARRMGTAMTSAHKYADAKCKTTNLYVPDKTKIPVLHTKTHTKKVKKISIVTGDVVETEQRDIVIDEVNTNMPGIPEIVMSNELDEVVRVLEILQTTVRVTLELKPIVENTLGKLVGVMEQWPSEAIDRNALGLFMVMMIQRYGDYSKALDALRAQANSNIDWQEWSDHLDAMLPT